MATTFACTATNYMAFPVTSFYVYHQVDWFQDELTEIHKKLRIKDTIENHKQVQEFKEMMSSHRDKQFKGELAKMREEVGILGEKDNSLKLNFSCDITQTSVVT